MRESLKTNDLKKGDMVSIIIESLSETEDGFVLGIDTEDGMYVYEQIDLQSYPSYNDFKGEKTRIKTGDIGTVCQYIGKPDRISGDGVWNTYDIYEVLIHGGVRQIFRRNLNIIN